MSRSYKKEVNRWLRNPRGKKRAIINKARSKAIPPDCWEDICVDKTTYHPGKVADALHKKDWSDDDIVNHLVNHYGYERWRILDQYWYNSRHEYCKCEHCLKKKKQ